MRKILYIAKTDIKNIITNPAAIIVLTALAFLPSLYAWLNIASSWDPYANTQGVAVAVSNLDAGTEIQDTEINIGNEIIVSLSKNDKLGWKFVTEDEAIQGVKHGDYYAAIVIPKDFSEKLTSIITDDIEKPKLEYYINEKVNAISPKVTSSGASGVVESIRTNFVEEANKAVMTVFNTMGIQLEENHLDIEKMRDKVFELEEALPDIQSTLRLAQRDLDMADFAIDKAHDGLDRVNDIDDRAKRLNKDLITMLEDSQESVDKTIESITKKLRSTQDTFRKIPDMTSDIAEKGDDFDSLISSLRDRQDGLDDVSKRIQEIYEFLKEKDEAWKESSAIIDMMARLKENELGLRESSAKLQDLIDRFNEGKHPSVSSIENVRQTVEDIISETNRIIADYRDVVVPRVQEILTSLEKNTATVNSSIDKLIKMNEDAISALDAMIGDSGNGDITKLTERLTALSSQLDKNIAQVDQGISALRVLQATVPGGVPGVDGAISRLENTKGALEATKKQVDDALALVNSGEELTPEQIAAIEGQLKASQTLEKMRDDLIATNKTLKSIKDNNNKRVDKLADDLKALDKRLKKLSERVQEAQKDLLHAVRVLEDAAKNPETSIALLETAIKRINSAADSMKAMHDSLRKFQDFVDSDAVTKEINRLLDLQNNIQKTKDSIDNMIERIENTKETGRKVLDNIDEMAANMDDSLEEMIDYINDELGPKYKDLTKDGIKALNNITEVLNDVNDKVPKVRDVLEKIRDGVGVGQEKLDYVNDHFPEARDAVEKAADQIRDIEAKGDLDNFIDMLKNDPSRVGDFFAQPVELDEHKLYPIPNYGSGMNPFYTTLSLWVGALLMVSTLKVDVERKDRFYSYQAYFGRMITFVGLGIIQAFIVAMGDIYIMETYTVDRLWFVLFTILSSITFVTIVYTLTSVFGNVGKVASIVLMVMQLGGSGGTFPIQMAPPFFQKIHEFLPFTHAISLLREAVGGIIWGVAITHIIYLVVYFVLAIIVGVGLKKFFNRSSDKFMKKAQKSKLVI